MMESATAPSLGGYAGKVAHIQEVRSPQVTYQLSNLQEVMVVLENAMAEHEKRLSGILRSSAPTPEPGASRNTEECLCQIAEAIRSVVHRANVLSRALQDMTDRVEV